MQALRKIVQDRLLADQTLYPTLVPGGIWNRPLKQGTKEPGNTDGAFYLDAARVVRLYPCIVVLGPNEVNPVDGPSQESEPTQLRNGFLRLYYYTPATEAGRTLIDDIDARVAYDLNDWQTIVPRNSLAATFTCLDMTESLDVEAYPGNQVVQRRVVAEYFRLRHGT